MAECRQAGSRPALESVAAWLEEEIKKAETQSLATVELLTQNSDHDRVPKRPRPRNKICINRLAQLLVNEERSQVSSPALATLLPLIVPFLLLQQRIKLLQASQYKLKGEFLRQLLKSQVFEENASIAQCGRALLLMTQARPLAIAWRGRFQAKCWGSASQEVVADLNRTFEDACQQNKMAHLLMAISNSMAGGYFQGLNMLVFFADQLVLTEEESYWVLLYILEKQGLNSLFLDNFREYRLLERLVEKALWTFLPQTAMLLCMRTPGLNYFMLRWVITLFSYDFDADLVQLVWVYFVCQGFGFVGGFVLALFEFLQARLLPLPDRELNELLKHNIRSVVALCDRQLLVRKASYLKLPWAEYRDSKEKDQLRLGRSVFGEVVLVEEDSSERVKSNQGSDDEEEFREEEKENEVEEEEKAETVTEGGGWRSRLLRQLLQFF